MRDREHLTDYVKRLQAQERILLEWQKDACKVLETASCACDLYHNFHCLRCRLLEEVHPDQRSHDAVGRRYGRVVVNGYAGADERRRPLVTYKCDCGNTGQARLDNLRSGKTMSCGCYRKEICPENWRKP
jgi:hypothetical protein